MKKAYLTVLAVLILLLFTPVRVVAAELPADGEYTADVTLSGGSGRASIESPARLTISKGAAEAVIIWSSPYYEYMVIEGVYYYPINEDGNSAFEIPVVLDEDMAVTAQTVAMSEPHEIDYTLHFDSGTLKPAGGGNAPVLVIAAVAVIVAAIALVIVMARKRGAARRREGHGAP
jgi:hypothetical protein